MTYDMGTCARYLMNRGRILGIFSDVDLVFLAQ